MPGLYALRSTSKPPVHGCQPAPPRTGAFPPALAEPHPHPLPSFHTRLTAAMASGAQPILSKPLQPEIQAPPHVHSPVNYSSSGSHHDPSSVCLDAMVHEFLEENLAAAAVTNTSGSYPCGRARCNCEDGVCSDCENQNPSEPEQPLVPVDQLREILEGVTTCTRKAELHLLADVTKAIEVASSLFDSNDNLVVDGSRIRRKVMDLLRKGGYNAAICKSRWNHGGGVPAGDYEYIDVVVEAGDSNERIIVDIDFRPQFEIARASTYYSQLLDVLPRVFVGRIEKLKQVVKVMCNAAKKSLKDQSLHLPPWRKQRYMLAKWCSSYRRTTNTESSSNLALKSSTSSEDLLGLALRAPGMEFTKEMDISYYKAVARMNRHHHQQQRCQELSSKMQTSTKTGFIANGDQQQQQQNVQIFGQKPCHQSTKVSGLSSALKQQAALMQKESSPQPAMVSVKS